MNFANSKIGPNTELREIQKQDAPEFIQLIDHNRVYLREWLGWLDVTKTGTDVEKYIDATRAAISKKEAVCHLIWHENQIAGIIHLRDIDYANKKGMIGYWVGQQFRGKGFATNATKAIVEHAFQELKLNRIEIRCATGNTASQAVPKKLGFKNEGVLHDNEWLYDHFVDHIVFGMLKRDWPRG